MRHLKRDITDERTNERTINLYFLLLYEDKVTRATRAGANTNDMILNVAISHLIGSAEIQKLSVPQKNSRVPT